MLPRDFKFLELVRRDRVWRNYILFWPQSWGPSINPDFDYPEAIWGDTGSDCYSFEPTSTETHAAGRSLMRKYSRAFALLAGYAELSTSSQEQYDSLLACLASYLATSYGWVNAIFDLGLSDPDLEELGLIPPEARRAIEVFHSLEVQRVITPETPEIRALMSLSRKLLLRDTTDFYPLQEEFIYASTEIYWYRVPPYFDTMISDTTVRYLRSSRGVWQAKLEEHGRMIDRVLSLQWYSRAGVRAQESSIFSTGTKRYFVQGQVGNRTVEALPDTGADTCLISKSLASELGLSAFPGTRKKIRLANRKPVQSPGLVMVPWKFAGESETFILKCWILPHCVHDVILGSAFLNATQTLTVFKSRIKSEFIERKRSLRLQLVGGESQQLWGYFNGELITAFPDTGSDVMLVSRAYAKKLGIDIDEDPANCLQIQFADGTTAWTSGIVRDVSWRVGKTEVYCDFYVLNGLCVDIVLSNDYLFEFNIFSECSGFFLDDSYEEEEELWRLCNIRLISQYGQKLDKLEEESLQDMTTPNAFSPNKIQRELARRDQIRDEIASLPEDKQSAARLDESERQRRWEELRRVHRARWNTATEAATQPASSSTTGKTQKMSAQKTGWRRRFQALMQL
ncbi:hypothetical protein BJX64DRAFT_265370 [Aspergillus heterothallicus]